MRALRIALALLWALTAALPAQAAVSACEDMDAMAMDAMAATETASAEVAMTATDHGHGAATTPPAGEDASADPDPASCCEGACACACEAVAPLGAALLPVGAQAPFPRLVEAFGALVETPRAAVLTAEGPPPRLL